MILRAYSEESVTIAQQKQIDYLLGLRAKNRQTQIDLLQQHLQAKEVFAEIDKHIEKLQIYKINIDAKNIDKQEQILQKRIFSKDGQATLPH